MIRIEIFGNLEIQVFDFAANEIDAINASKIEKSLRNLVIT